MLANEYSAKRYRRLVDNRLCPKCGKPAPEGHMLCDFHRAQATERTRLDRAWYREHGICPYCRKEKLFGDEKQCISCRLKYHYRKKPTEEQRAKRNERFREQERERYAERSAQGICTRCGKLKAVEGRKKCGICLDKANNNRKRRMGINTREFRVENGLCWVCGGENDMDGKMCSKCIANLRPNTTYDRSNHPWKLDNNIAFGKG